MVPRGNTVRIEHRDDLKHGEFTERTCSGGLAAKKINDTIDHVARGRLTWVHTRRKNDILSLSNVLLRRRKIRDGEKWHRVSREGASQKRANHQPDMSVFLQATCRGASSCSRSVSFSSSCGNKAAPICRNGRGCSCCRRRSTSRSNQRQLGRGCTTKRLSFGASRRWSVGPDNGPD